jgi:hypothetical protein
MLSKLLNKKKNWFTLIELLLVCSAFAILVSGVIIAINRAYAFMNDTKIRVRASNFAREWVEIMFNIRDTNWRRHSGERDANRLNTSLTWDNTFEEWLYVLKEWITGSGDKYFYADKVNDLSDVTSEEYYSDSWFWGYDRQEWRMEFEWDYNYMEYVDDGWVPRTWSIQDVLFNETEFYRLVRVFGIYCKEEEGTNITVDSCSNDSAPKEMRFCVKVFYTHDATRSSSELCSVMTNFME